MTASDAMFALRRAGWRSALRNDYGDGEEWLLTVTNVNTSERREYRGTDAQRLAVGAYVEIVEMRP